ncbi:Aph-1, partial [Coccomyxa subellipsoidea C-169]
FLGCALIAGGPGLAIFWTFLRRKAFLVLLILACAFGWLVGLLLTSMLFRGFVPLENHTGALAAALLVGVAVQEAMRLGCWQLHRKLVVALGQVAEKMEGAGRITREDEQLLALAQGWAHGATHSLFFYYSWLPLFLGKGTFYLDECPQMSYFLAGALLTLAFNLLHTFSMVIAFDGLREGKRERWAAVPIAHLGAALLTLVNLRPNGCLGSVPLLLLLGLGSAVAAGYICWQ